MATIDAESALRSGLGSGPTTATVPRYARPRTKLIVGGLVMVLALAYLTYTGLQAGAVYYLTVAELEAKGSAAYGERLRVAGKVLAGSIEREGGLVRFAVVDAPSLQQDSAPGLLARLFPPRPVERPALGPRGSVAAAAEAQQLRVSYRGVVPDIFGDDVDVVVEGRLSSPGVFDATTLLAKCPSRFEGSGQPVN